MLKMTNDMDSIYAKGLIETVKGYQCSVCGKEYKQHKSAQKHFDKRACYRLSDIFADTPFEKTLYSFYKDVCALRGIHAVGLSQFRKKSDYTRLAKFCQFCIEHDLHTIYQYAEWLIYYYNKESNPYVAFSIGQNASVLNQFRLFLRNNEMLIDNESYFEQHRDKLETDATFAVQSILSGKIGRRFFFKNVDMERFLNNMSKAEEMLLDEFLKSYES